MGKVSPALALYLLSSLIYVLSVALHWDELITFLFKPMMMPAILFYYFQENKGNVNFFAILVLVLFFAGDMLILIEVDSLLAPLMLINLSAYLIIGFFLVRDLLLVKNPQISAYMIAIICLVICFLLSLLYVALKLIFDKSDANYELLTVYGIVLFLLSLGTVFLHLIKGDTSAFYLAITMLCLVLCDLFYVLYNYYMKLPVFININVFLQSISFYFIVKYFLSRTESNLISEF
ncbi:hypothetical protein [Flavobacterium sp.]|uniref:hypothetical protein n=1 Tax=Flavobacterium sp. TaxID=239 RepID=UPI0028BF20C9|nr:hypothetical protein [Flavobacterium sp.]